MSEPLDRISLTGLSATGYHGVFDFEKREGQTFRVDLVLECDTSRAATSDDLADTINYAEIAEAVYGHITGAPVDLIETLASRIAGTCLADSRVQRVHVTVHKPQAPIDGAFDDVSVSITRARQ
jgi:dihydroneopterin aldolase